MAWSQLNYVCRAMVWNYDETTPSDSRIYMGLDQHLYRYNVAGDYYEYCSSLKNLQDESSTPIQDLLAGDDDVNDYVIKRLWNIDDGYIYGAAWKEDDDYSKKVILFKWDSSNELDSGNLEYIDLLSNVLTGEKAYKEWTKNWVSNSDWNNNHWYRNHRYEIGTISLTPTQEDNWYFLSVEESWNLPLLFSQYITSKNNNRIYADADGNKIYNRDYENRGAYQKEQSSENTINFDLTGSETLDRGYYRFSGTKIQNFFSTDGGTLHPPNPHLGFSIGQSSYINMNDSGEILYSTVSKTEADRGRVERYIWDAYWNSENMEGYRYDHNDNNEINSITSSGDYYSIRVNSPDGPGFLTDLYSIDDYKGCRFYTSFANTEGWAYIKDINGFSDHDNFIVSSFHTRDGTSWDDLDPSTQDNYFIITAPHYQYNLKTYNTSDNSSGNVSNVTSIDDIPDTETYMKVNEFQPTCSTVNNDGNWMVAGRNWEENRPYLGYSYIYETPVSSGDSTNMVMKWKRFAYVITYMDFWKNDTLFVCFINLREFGSGYLGQVGTLDYSGTVDSNNINYIDYFSEIPVELRQSENDSDTYYVTTSAGLVYEYFYSDGSWSSNILGYGDSFVDNEAGLSSNMEVISSSQVNNVDDLATRYDDLLMGVSSPTPSLLAQEDIIPGKYYLWKLDNYLSDRVEVADFSDMNIWQAISQLLKLSYGHVGGFSSDESSSFFLKQKDFENSDIVLEVSSDIQDDNLISLEKSRGLDQIYNYVEMLPYRTQKSDVSFELYKSARSDNTDTFVNDGDIDLNINSDFDINYVLMCERGGDVNSPFSQVQTAPLFKWQVLKESIKATLLRSAAVDDTVIVIDSSFRGLQPPRDDDGSIVYSETGININDYLKIVNDDTQNEKYIKIVEIVQDDYDYWRILHLAEGIPFELTDGTTVEIVSSFGLESEVDTFDTKWSDDGVGFVQSSAEQATYDYLGFQLTETEKSIWIDSKRHISEGTILTSSTSDYWRIKDIGDWSADKGGWKVTFADTQWARSSIFFDIGDKVKAYYSPCQENLDTSAVSYSYFEIGNTGDKIKIEPSNNTNVSFQEGDQIRINSEGLKLEEDKASRQISQNTNSISKYDKQELNGIDCKFLTMGHAYHYARKIIDDFSYPKYKLTVVTDYSPDIDFINSNGLATIKVHNHPLFKPYNSIQCYIEEIKHDIRGGTTTLILRSVDPY